MSFIINFLLPYPKFQNIHVSVSYRIRTRICIWAS